MFNMIKQACSWLVSKVRAGIDWVRNNWPAIQAQAEKMGQWFYGVAINHVRQVVVTFQRGVVTAIETAERRQAMPFPQAFLEAKGVVQSMTDEQVSNYAVYWFRKEPAAAVVA
ncbi:MAG: hypothetical protein ACOZFS_09830 [Thermodesulfobacteriota bacterium]